MGTRAASSKKDQILFDSDVLIWVLRGSEKARRFVETVAPSNRIVPVVVVMEIMKGCQDHSDLRRTRRFIEGSFAGTVQISEEISRRAAALVERYSRSHRIEPDDALVAATALTVRAPLATGNVSDYRYVTGLSLKPFRH